MLAPVSTVARTAFLLPIAAASVDSVALQRAEEALARLSLEEKVALLAGNGTMTIAAQPKIGLAEEFWFSDGPHTVRPELDRNNFNSANRSDDHSTVLPTLSALAATWDTELAFRFGETLGREARDRGKDVLLGPGVNLQRTPLNGRNYEYLGEDPHLASRLAVAYVKGVQSQDVGACVKHFVGNDQELARGSVDVVMDEPTLRELYLAPFEAAVVEGGALTVMNGYNRFRGEFCSHNAYLNHQVLKSEWGFPGFVVSDWGGVHETVAGALGGLDVEMHAGEAIRHFRAPLVEAVRDGRVPLAVVDEMARRVLYVMAKIGKLGGRERARGARNTADHHALAREVAEQAIVLLKNDRAVLPLSAGRVRRLLVIGANADVRHTSGGWSAEGKPLFETTPLQGLRGVLSPDVELTHIPGPFTEIYSPLPESVIATVDSSDLARGAAQKGWLVDYFAAETPAIRPSGEGFERVVDCHWGARPPSFASTRSARFKVEIIAPESGVYRFELLHDGKARLAVDGVQVIDSENPPSALRGATGSAELAAGRRHSLVVEFSRAVGEGRCSFGWRLPSRSPISPENLAARAKDADAVVFLTGNRLGHGRAQECEGADRPSLALPEGENEAVTAVLASRPDTVVVNQSGAPVDMPWADQASTLVQYWFSGMDGGTALARVLFGLVNPSGRLPFSIPRNLADTPAHALGEYGPVRVEYKEGLFIGYRWHDSRNIAPLFPFGHGLSYTTFAIGSPEPEFTSIRAGETLRVRVPVSNTGRKTGAEVVQLYLGHPVSSLPRPIRELRAFAKVSLQPGEIRLVELELPARAFSVWDDTAKTWRIDAGEYTLESGASSRALAAPVTVLLR